MTRVGNRHQIGGGKELPLPLLERGADDLVLGAGDEQHALRIGAQVIGEAVGRLAVLDSRLDQAAVRDGALPPARRRIDLALMIFRLRVAHAEHPVIVGARVIVGGQELAVPDVVVQPFGEDVEVVELALDGVEHLAVERARLDQHRARDLLGMVIDVERRVHAAPAVADQEHRPPGRDVLDQGVQVGVHAIVAEDAAVVPARQPRSALIPEHDEVVVGQRDAVVSILEGKLVAVVAARPAVQKDDGRAGRVAERLVVEDGAGQRERRERRVLIHRPGHQVPGCDGS